MTEQRLVYPVIVHNYIRVRLGAPAEGHGFADGGGEYVRHRPLSAAEGDGDPRWTEVWSHIQLGKIFDITGQRERAVNEYRQALQTNDNTQGAGDEARKYIQKPYEREKQTAPGA